MTLPTGTKLAHYQISELIGAGGMGMVYRSRDLRLNRDVALKILTQEMRANREAIARFAREARTTAALSHPNIVAIYDIGEYQEMPFVVMELLQGTSLRVRLRQSALDWREAVRVGIAVANGLAAAHEAGIVHRDLKPENIFLTNDNQVKILDFGLAHIREKEAEGLDAPTDLFAPTIQAITKPGMLLGTPGYMAPEQTQSQQITAAADLFAFGCVLYEMLTGQPLFLRSTTAETLAATLRDHPPSLRRSGGDIPPQLDQLLAHCLAKAPLQRLPSAQKAASELQGLLSTPHFVSYLTLSLNQTWLRRPSRRQWLSFGLSTLAVGGGWAGYRVLRPSQYESLAVLPISNESGDANLEYLCDGLTETLINKFAQLPQLHIIARTTAFGYKNQPLDLHKIKRELNVDAVLTGKLNRLGGNLVIQMDLVNVHDGSQLWGERYNRSLVDVFSLQEGIAREIAGKLQPRLTDSQTELLTKRDTLNAEANDLYFKGLLALNQREEPDTKLSIQYFEQALSADPRFALARLGLARAYILAGNWIEPSQAMEEARKNALAALQLDPTLADAHTSLAVVLMLHDWKFEEAEQSFRRALALRPNDANAYHWYAEYLTAMTRHAEAITAIQQAQKLDPRSFPVNRDVAWHYYCARRYDEALAQCQRTMKMNPNVPNAYLLLGRILLQMGKGQMALTELQKAVALRQANNGSPGNSTLAELSYAYAVTGEKAKAYQLLKELQTSEKSLALPMAAAAYATLGEYDQAFEILDQALQKRASALVYLKARPAFDVLQNDARWPALLQKIGLRP